MPRYETVFILTPNITPESAREAAAKFRRILTDIGCKILYEEQWGLTGEAGGSRLQDERWGSFDVKANAYYRLIEYQAPNGSAVTELETAFKRDERILQFRTIQLGR